MITIWKYPLMLELRQQYIHVPSEPRFRHFGFDADGGPSLWLEVSDELEKKAIQITRVGTGQAVPEGTVYLGTIVSANRLEVWHFYCHAGDVLFLRGSRNLRTEEL